MVGEFLHGSAVRGPHGGRLVLQTRISGVVDDVVLRWEVSSEDRPDVGAAAGEAVARGAADHTVRVVVDGLEPVSGTATGSTAIGRPAGVRFRTLPEDPERLRFAVVCCAKFNSGFFNRYGRVAERDDLDFVLHAGDYIYEAAQTPPASQTPGADIGRPMDPLPGVPDPGRVPDPLPPVPQRPGPRALHAAHAVIPDDRRPRARGQRMERRCAGAPARSRRALGAAPGRGAPGVGRVGAHPCRSRRCGADLAGARRRIPRPPHYLRDPHPRSAPGVIGRDGSGARIAGSLAEARVRAAPARAGSCSGWPRPRPGSGRTACRIGHRGPSQARSSASRDGSGHAVDRVGRLRVRA